MPAGHDFDALLMGSLYGELSAVEESRLQAHLAANPSDHEVLRSLLRTREAIRKSAALAQVEPPQAISALLLQEAARRAPRKAAAGAGSSRLGRWFASFAAHPALAAATMAMVAVGTASALYLRGVTSAPEPKASSLAPAALEDEAAATAAPADPAAGASAGESFAVDLAKDQTSNAGGDELARQIEQAKPRAAAQEAPARPKVEPTRLRKPAPEQAEARNRRDEYVATTVSDFDIPLKQLDEEDAELQAKEAKSPVTEPPLVISGSAAPSTAAAARSEVDSSLDRAQPSGSVGKKGAAAGAGLPGAAAPGPAPAAPAAPAYDSSRSRGAVGASPAPAPAITSEAAAGAPADDKLAGKGEADDKWAKAEHARLVRLARGNKCTEAAAVARQLSERAPRYYQERVLGDRELRSCSSAIRDALNLRPDAKRKATRGASESNR